MLSPRRSRRTRPCAAPSSRARSSSPGAGERAPVAARACHVPNSRRRPRRAASCSSWSRRELRCSRPRAADAPGCVLAADGCPGRRRRLAQLGRGSAGRRRPCAARRRSACAAGRGPAPWSPCSPAIRWRPSPRRWRRAGPRGMHRGAATAPRRRRAAVGEDWHRATAARRDRRVPSPRRHASPARRSAERAGTR